MADALTLQAVSGITDPDQIRVSLYINNQQVHAPLVDVIMTTLGLMPLEGNLDLGGFNIVNAPNVVSNTKVTVFTASGTFTPDAKMICCEVTAFGGGGGGGGSQATGAGQNSVATGGNGGAKAMRRLTKAQIGASQTVTIGAGGAGQLGNVGLAGGNTTLGTLVSAKGGEGGNVGPTGAAFSSMNATDGTQSATGDVRGYTFPATFGNLNSGTTVVQSVSGQNELGGARTGSFSATGTAAPANTGAGGGGTANGVSTTARTGGAGGSGLMIITEYLST